MSDITAQQETTFRWDNEEHTLYACTTDPRVKQRWERAGFPVAVFGTVRGEPRSWSLTLPWTGRRKPWSLAFQRAIPGWDGPSSEGSEADDARDADEAVRE